MYSSGEKRAYVLGERQDFGCEFLFLVKGLAGASRDTFLK